MAMSIAETLERLRNNKTVLVDELRMLSEAYLAEHPADDDEPIDGDWLATDNSFKKVDGQHWIHVDLWPICLRQTREAISLLVGSSATGWWTVSPAATRGQVRRLLEALSAKKWQ